MAISDSDLLQEYERFKALRERNAAGPAMIGGRDRAAYMRQYYEGMSSTAAARAHEQLLEELRTRDRPITYRSPPRGPRTALPPQECERNDCYFHQHYGRGCKATIVVMDGLTCRTYRQLIGEVCDHA